MITAGNEPFVFEFSKIGSPSLGYISVAERDLMLFPVKRVYWTYYTPDEVIRGNHAHMNLLQVLIATSGRITVEVEDRSGIRREFALTKPSMGLFVPAGCWCTLSFSHDAVLMCLASEVFIESDYIRDYATFKSFIKNG